MSFQYMPLYTGDYLRDTRHLSCSEHGIYCLFLMQSWDSRGPLPLDERRLMGITNARSTDEIEAMRRVLAEFFVKMEDGYYNVRMQEEISRANFVSRSRSDAGRIGVEARKLKRSAQDKQLLSTCSALAKHLPVDHTPTPILRTTGKPYKASSDALPDLPAAAGSPAEQAEAVQGEVLTLEPPQRPSPVPYQAIVDLYHLMLPQNPRIVRLTESRKAKIRARWGEMLDNLNEWRDYFSAVAESSFLTGKVAPSPGRKRFVADLEWLTTEGNFVKVAEGRYRDG